MRISLETVDSEQANDTGSAVDVGVGKDASDEKLTTSKLARKLGLKTSEFLSKMVDDGFLTVEGDEHILTQKGVDLGAEAKSGRYGSYFIWPAELTV